MRTTIIALCLAVLLVSCRHDDIDLRAVDTAIEEADAAQQTHAASIAADAAAIDAMPLSDLRFERQLELALRLKSYDTRASLDCLDSAVQTATAIGSVEKAEKAAMRVASVYCTQNLMLKDASDIFNSLNSGRMSPENRMEYFVLGVQLYRNLADNSYSSRHEAPYRHALAAYRDSVLSMDPGSTLIDANRLIDAGETDRAEALLLNEISRMEDLRYAGPSYHVLATLYRIKGDAERERHYLALAAATDLSNGVREYKALTELATMLAGEGDIDRAHRYIHRSYADATAAHAYQRKAEIERVIPVIDAAYAQSRERVLALVIAVGCLLLVIACVVTISLRMLHRKNVQLAASAARLAEESRVKQSYITGFMELCLTYLKKMESFRAELNKIAARRDLDALVKAISSSRYVNREVADFYGKFDEAFLRLYPDFIEQLNEQLRPENRYDVCKGFNTELRIYALIRLGVTGSGEIARFLRVSDSTVYNYRTAMRNRAVDREGFETKIAGL